MNIPYSKHCLQRMIEQKGINQLQSALSEEECRLIKQQAAQLKQHIFTFDKPWDMERCLTPYQLNPMDFNAQRHEDEEWCFMLNRMDYLDYLMYDGLLGDESGYQSGLKLMLTWIDQHPILTQSASTRTLDTGIRIMNMMEALPVLAAANQLSEEQLEKILQSLLDQICYLREAYLPKYTLSNWGSIQTCAILSVLPLLEEDYAADPIFQWARQEAATQFSIQVYDDGMQWEQSTMYHIEVLNYAMKAVYYQRFYGYQPVVKLEEQSIALTQALFYQMTPQGEIETFGDSDRVSLQDVLIRGAILFQAPIWKAKALDRVDMESLYSFGYGAVESYAALKVQQPRALVYDGVDSGMYVMRSSWEADASFTMFTHGSLGSGHGHSDNLHISLYYQGEPFLIDSGRYTYREDHPMRVALKGMRAHNGVLIDDHAYCQPSDSWGYAAFGLPIKPYVRHMDTMHYLEGMMVGAHPLQLWTRKLVVIDPGIWVILDEVKQDGQHTMKQYFHVDPAKRTEVIAQGYRIHGTASLQLINEEAADRQVENCSLRYNELQDHDVISFSKAFEDTGYAITCILPEGAVMAPCEILQNLDTPLSENIASARKICLSPSQSYTIILFHQELYQGKKICSCEGVPFHAKAVVIHECDGKKTMWRLKA